MSEGDDFIDFAMDDKEPARELADLLDVIEVVFNQESACAAYEVLGHFWNRAERRYQREVFNILSYC